MALKSIRYYADKFYIDCKLEQAPGQHRDCLNVFHTLERQKTFDVGFGAIADSSETVRSEIAAQQPCRICESLLDGIPLAVTSTETSRIFSGSTVRSLCSTSSLLKKTSTPPTVNLSFSFINTTTTCYTTTTHF